MGGRSEGRQTQNQTTTMPPNQDRNANTLLSDALAYYNTGGPKYFQGDTVAPTDPNQTAGRGAMLDYASGAGQVGVNAAQGANNYWLNPSTLNNFSSIPGYDASRQQIINGATQNLTDNQLPVIRDDAIMSGNYGGTSQQIGEALATSRTNEAIAGQLGNLDLGLYNTNANMQNQALNRSTGMYDLGLMPGQTQEQVGAMNRGDQQQQIDADISKWNFDQMAPLLNLQALQALTGSAGQYGGTTSGQSTGGASGGNGMLPVLGGLLSLFGMMGG